MVTKNRGLFTSSISLKVGILLLFIGFILHVVGVSIARWTSVTMLHSESKSLRPIYHVGLWKHCVCTDRYLEECTCFTHPDNEPAWLDAVQGMELLGLMGWFISGITCLVIVCHKQTIAVKRFNVFSILCSGLSILIGLIIFGVENGRDSHEFFDTFSNLDPVEAHGRLDSSFFLCTVAAGIALIPCLCLFVIDLRTDTARSTERQQQMVTGPVQFSNQGQIITAPWNQVQVMANVADQHPMKRLVPEYGQNTLAPPPYTPQVTGGWYTSNIQKPADGIQHNV